MRIIDVLHSPWAIKPDRLIEINEIYARHLRGEKISRDTILAIEAATGKPLDNKTQAYDVINGVAVLPLSGVISKRMNLFTQISGGTSSQLFTRDFNAVMDDPAIKAVIMDVDSPGGTVDGTQEGADNIFNARGKKPIITYSGGMMASAAYWYGSAADAIYIGGDTVDVGSIGVVTSHTDYSKAEEAMGIKTTEITAGQYKRIASEHAPLTDAGKAYIQEQLDHIYNVFLSTVGRNRGGLSNDQVHARMADGRIFIGKKAIEAGLVDGISTLDGLIQSLAAGVLPGRKKAAQISVPVRISASQEQTAAGDAAAETKITREEIMNITELKEKHPDLYAAVFAEGQAAAKMTPEKCDQDCTAKGKKEGAAAELSRIQAVKGVSMPGHEALIETLMFDGKTTGPEAAMKIVTAENAKRKTMAQAIAADGKDLNVPAADGLEGSGEKVMKRAQFVTLSPNKQSAFIQGGGKVTD